MKRLFVLSFLLLGFLANIAAQITITRSDYAVAGDFMRYEIDTPAAGFISPIALQTGLNKLWNFSSVPHSYVYDSMTFAAVPPEAPTYSNLLVNSRYGAHYENADNNGVKRILDRPNNNMTGLYIDFLRFPISYGNSFKDSLKYSKIGTPSNFNAPFLGTIGYDSLQAKITVFDTISCIGSGTLILPDTSCQVILIKVSSLAATNLYGRMPSTGWRSINLFLGLDSTQRTIEYFWMAKNGKSYLARAVLNASGTAVMRFDRFVKAFVYPTIKSIAQDLVAKGNTVDMQINCSGTSFKTLPGFSFSLKKGNYKLAPNSLNIVNDSTVIANITAKQVDSVGSYDLQLLDPLAGLIKKSSAFTVLPFERTPKLLGLSTKTGKNNTQLVDTLRASGTHFSTKTSTVSVKFLKNGLSIKGIKASDIRVLNDSLLSFSLSIDSTVEFGSFDLHAYNWIDSLLVLDSAFEVGIPNGLVSKLSKETGITIYPNPAKDYLSIQLVQSPSEETVLSIFDMQGKCMKEERIIEKETRINTSNWSKGIYVLKIKTATDLASRVFVVE